MGPRIRERYVTPTYCIYSKFRHITIATQNAFLNFCTESQCLFQAADDASGIFGALLPSITGFSNRDFDPWYNEEYSQNDINSNERIKRNSEDNASHHGTFGTLKATLLKADPQRHLAKMLRSFANMVENFDG